MNITLVAASLILVAGAATTQDSWPGFRGPGRDGVATVASPTPITDGKSLYVYFGRAGVFALDLDGNKLWRTDLGEPDANAPKATNGVARGGKQLVLRWGSAASPLLYDDLVIVNCSEESNSIRALDKKTGKLVWKRESSNLEGSAISPVIAGRGDGRVLVVGLAGAIWGLLPATGELLWRVETGTRGGMSPTPVADDELVYAFGGMGKSHAIRYAPTAGETDRIAWQGENVGIPSPVLEGGRLFLVRQNGIAACIDAKDGTTLFNGRLDGRTGSIYASPVIAGGRIYIVSRKRGTFVYSADGKFKLLANNRFEDKTQFNGSAAIVGKQVFLRSDSFLYCVSGS